MAHRRNFYDIAPDVINDFFSFIPNKYDVLGTVEVRGARQHPRKLQDIAIQAIACSSGAIVKSQTSLPETLKNRIVTEARQIKKNIIKRTGKTYCHICN